MARRGPRYRVRPAHDGDMPVVRDLYNALIPTTTVAWTETPETLRAKRLEQCERYAEEFIAPLR